MTPAAATNALRILAALLEGAIAETAPQPGPSRGLQRGDDERRKALLAILKRIDAYAAIVERSILSGDARLEWTDSGRALAAYMVERERALARVTPAEGIADAQRTESGAAPPLGVPERTPGSAPPALTRVPSGAVLRAVRAWRRGVPRWTVVRDQAPSLGAVARMVVLRLVRKWVPAIAVAVGLVAVAISVGVILLGNDDQVSNSRSQISEDTLSGTPTPPPEPSDDGRIRTLIATDFDAIPLGMALGSEWKPRTGDDSSGPAVVPWPTAVDRSLRIRAPPGGVTATCVVLGTLHGDALHATTALMFESDAPDARGTMALQIGDGSRLTAGFGPDGRFVAQAAEPSESDAEFEPERWYRFEITIEAAKALVRIVEADQIILSARLAMQETTAAGSSARLCFRVISGIEETDLLVNEVRVEAGASRRAQNSGAG